ncbi:hypothetical protein RND81_14G174000 [Saponaria officinalis]|uniref:KIB1-4 beta-propeller domain-containing protein n=1 Tax=Saponaria officinalis TaxID=3572 RepID=A0AAW1GQV1_SAPOF
MRVKYISPYTTTATTSITRRPRRISPYYCRQFTEPSFTNSRHWDIQTTSVYFVASSSSATLWVVAAAAAGGGRRQLLHPLTLKPHPSNLPENINVFDDKAYYTHHVVSFHRTNFRTDVVVIPPPRYTVKNDAMLVLYGGGQLIGRLPVVEVNKPLKWVKFYGQKFDDIIIYDPKTYVVDREGKLFLINNDVKSRRLNFGEMVVARPVTPGPGRVGWRKRLVGCRGEMYMVVREAEKVFRVYKLSNECMSKYWKEVKGFDGGVSLCMSKDCYFFKNLSVEKDYENCIVFLEAGFPIYGDDGWEYKCEDEIWVFRLSDGSFGRVGGSVDFPEIDWSPPSWIFDGREPDEDDGDVKLISEDKEEQDRLEFYSDSQDQEQEKRSDSDIQGQEDGRLQRDSNSQETEDVEMLSNGDIEDDASLQEDVPPSLFASFSALEEEVTRTLLRMNGGNEAIEEGNGNEAIEEEPSRENITVSTPRACTSSSTKSCKCDLATAKFEGFDIRSALIPTLQKIWRKHGNITENSTMCSGDIIARALESLATMVQILENNSVESLSDSQADYLSTTLSDLKTMCFKVHWLVSFVEKAVKLHKSKAFLESLNKLSELSSQVKEQRAIFLDKVAKLTEKENKLKKQMAKMSMMIPYQVKFDEPFGSGL